MLGRYSFSRRLGAGSFGAVFLAFDEKEQAKVCLGGGNGPGQVLRLFASTYLVGVLSGKHTRSSTAHWMVANTVVMSMSSQLLGGDQSGSGYDIRHG